MATKIKNIVTKPSTRKTQPEEPTDGALLAQRDYISEKRALDLIKKRQEFRDAETRFFNLEKVYGADFVKSLMEKYKI